MKYLMIIIGLVLMSTGLQAQNISFQQKKQLQNIGIKNQQKLQKQLSTADQKRLRQIQNEADSVGRISSPRMRSKAIQSFNQKYAGFRTSIMRKAGFDNDAYFREVKAVFPQANLKKGKQGFYAVNKQVLRSKGPKVRVDPKFKTIQPQPKKVKVASKKSNSASSFTSTDASVGFESTGCGGNGYNGQFKNENGFSSFSSAGGAGGCVTIRGTGNNVQVPEGVKRVRVKVTLGDGFDLSATALGALGYGHCQTEVGIRVKGPGIEEFFKDSDIISIAPVLYFSEIDATEFGPYEMEVVFTPASNGGNYRIQAYGKTFSMGIAGGMGVGYTSVDKVDKIEAIFEY